VERIGDYSNNTIVGDALVGRRALGDAGHVPSCARDHALDTACAPADAHEVAQRRVEDARAALPELLRHAYALDEGQAATVLRVCDALAEGVSLEAREALGREALSTWNEGSQLVSSWEDIAKLSGLQEDWRRTGERLFALGRASREQWAQLRAAGVPVAEGVGV
jgi:hypothetical protein